MRWSQNGGHRNGFDAVRFCPATERKRRILVVTRLFERKGVQTRIRARSEIERPPDRRRKPADTSRARGARMFRTHFYLADRGAAGRESLP